MEGLWNVLVEYGYGLFLGSSDEFAQAIDGGLRRFCPQRYSGCHEK